MFNRVILLGRFTADPQFNRYSQEGCVAHFSVATDTGWNKTTGEKYTDFIECVAWGKTAEFVSQYFRKGMLVSIIGTLKNNNFTDRHGVKHYSYTVRVDEITFAESKTATQQREANMVQQSQYQGQPQYNQPQTFTQQVQQANRNAQGIQDELQRYEQQQAQGYYGGEGQPQYHPRTYPAPQPQYQPQTYPAPQQQQYQPQAQQYNQNPVNSNGLQQNTDINNQLNGDLADFEAILSDGEQPF